MPDHHLLNGLFSHGGREKYPPAALNWVLAVPNLIHTYIYTYTLYLNIRHNQVACILYQEITGNEKMNMKPPPVTSKDQMEIWWDQQIRTITKIEKNKHDIIIWHSDRQLCQ